MPKFRKLKELVGMPAKPVPDVPEGYTIGPEETLDIPAPEGYAPFVTPVPGGRLGETYVAPIPRVYEEPISEGISKSYEPTPEELELLERFRKRPRGI